MTELDKLTEAFDKQMTRASVIDGEDFNTESQIRFCRNDFSPAEWADLIELHTEKLKYSSGQAKNVGDLVLQGFVVSNTSKPRLITLAYRELNEYTSTHDLVRTVDDMPVLVLKNDKPYMELDHQEKI